MVRNGRLPLAWFFLSIAAVACGARSSLLVPDDAGHAATGGGGAGVGGSVDASADAPFDAPDDGFVDAPADADAADDSGDAPYDAPDDVLDAPDDVVDALDAPEDAPLDVCTELPHCDPNDLSRIFQCGAVIEHCGLLEQCEELPGIGADCINPCVNTLGQDTSNGCEFYAAEFDQAPEAAGACYAVFVVNQWKTGAPAKLEVSRAGVVLPIDQFARIPVGKGSGITYAPFSSMAGLPKDEIAILFLSRDPAALSDPTPTAPRRLASCPDGVTPAVVGDAAQHGTGVGEAFRIKSNVPIVAYQIFPYGAGRARVTSATLLFPTNVWDTNYVAVNAYPAPTLFTQDRAGPTMLIMGKEDGTQVTIKPVADIVPGGGLTGTPANVPITYTVNRGQYLQFTQPTELTGSAIQADRPVAVIGGSTLLDVPLPTARADSAHQMLPPVRALANEYVAVRYRSRDKLGEESVPWRVVGVADGTVLTYEPLPPVGAPAILDAGEVFNFDAPGPFVVKSQDAEHPFYMAGYMTGGATYNLADAGTFNGEGDPEFVNLIAPKQYLARYTFFTDPTYPETNLVIVRVKDPDTGLFPDISLDCAGLVGGFAPVGTSGDYELARIDLSSGDFAGQNGCDNGVHVIEGSVPFASDAGPAPVARFGVTIWGWGSPITYNGTDETDPKQTRWVSYAYPAGANLAKLNNVLLPAN